MRRIAFTLATLFVVAGCSGVDSSDSPARRSVTPGMAGTDVPVGTGGNAGGGTGSGSPGPVNGGSLNGPGIGAPVQQ